MHVLIATPFLPWPLFEGGRVAQYRTFEAMRNACSFTLVVPVYSDQEATAANKFAEMFPNVRVKAVRCSPSATTPSRRAVVRMAMGRLKRRIFPPSAEAAQAREKAVAPVPEDPFYRLNSYFVNEVAEQFAKGCDIFQAEFADMMSLGPFMGGRVPSMFVHHQLHFVYARRFLAANGGGTANAQYVAQRMMRQEEAYLKTFDATIVFSEVDREALKSLCPSLDVSVSPFPSPEDPTSAAIPYDKPTGHFVFVASETHRPNYEGFRWFMKDVWPGIKAAVPGARIEVIGLWSKSGKTSLPNCGDIHFSGFAPELLPALHHKIMIVPIWVGSGIRTKILAAWSASCPVVTTSVGVEGLPGVTGEHFLMADNAGDFQKACVELSQSPSKLNGMAEKALDLVQRDYSLTAVRRTRLAVYERLLSFKRSPRNHLTQLTQASLRDKAQAIPN